MKQKGIKPFFTVPAFNETPLFLGSIWVSAVPLLLPKLNLTLLTVVVARFSEMDLNTYPCNHKAAVLYPSGPNHCFRTTQKCQVTSSSLKPLYLCCFFSIACIEKVGTNSYEFYPRLPKGIEKPQPVSNSPHLFRYSMLLCSNELTLRRWWLNSSSEPVSVSGHWQLVSSLQAAVCRWLLAYILAPAGQGKWRWGTFVIYDLWSSKDMRHQEAIDERLIKGRNADWHFDLRIIKGRQNESSRFGGAGLMKR